MRTGGPLLLPDEAAQHANTRARLLEVEKRQARGPGVIDFCVTATTQFVAVDECTPPWFPVARCQLWGLHISITKVEVDPVTVGFAIVGGGAKETPELTATIATGDLVSYVTADAAGTEGDTSRYVMSPDQYGYFFVEAVGGGGARELVARALFSGIEAGSSGLVFDSNTGSGGGP